MENTRRWRGVSSGGAVQLVHGILKREKTRMKERKKPELHSRRRRRHRLFHTRCIKYKLCIKTKTRLLRM